MQVQKRFFLSRQISETQIFFLAFVIYFIPTNLLETTFSGIISDHYLRIFSYMSIPLLLFKIFVLDNWQKRKLILITGALFLGCINWRVAHNVELLMWIPFVIGAKNVKFKDIIKWYVYLISILLLLLIIYSLLGIIPNLVFHPSFRPPRYSLGTIYPSVISAHFLFLVLAYCYLRFNKLNIFDYVLIIIGSIICMKLTNTRLDFVATIITIPVMIVAQRAYNNYYYSRLITSFLWMATPILCFLMNFLCLFYNPKNKLLHALDALFSGRLALCHDAFNKYSINFWGRTIVEHSFVGIKGLQLSNHFGDANVHYFYIDSSFVRMVILWGLFAFVSIIVCTTFIALRATIDQTFVLSAIIFVASLNFMFEPHIIQIVYNPFILSLLATRDYINFQEDKQMQKRTIGLSDVSKVMWKNIITIMAVTLIFGLIGGLYAKHKKHTIYDSERNIMISHSYNGSAANEEVQADINLGKTYAKIVESKDTIKAAHKKLPSSIKHAYSVNQISKMVSAHPVFQTTIVKVKVSAKSAKSSAQIVNAISVASVKQIEKSVPSAGQVRLFAKATAGDAQSSSSPSIKKYTLLGAAIGFLLGMVVSFSITTWKHLI